MSIRLSDNELRALQGLPHAVCWLYVMIRTRMDYSTGFVGALPGSRISWKALMEEMYVDPHKGVTGTGSPAKSKVRRWVQWLVRSGLLKLVNDEDGYLVFFCNFAVTDFSVQKKGGTNPAYLETQKADTLHASSDADYGNKGGTNPAHHENAKPGIHPVSGTDCTVLYSARVDSDVPKIAGEWLELMMSEKSFPHHIAQTAKTMPMYRRWCELGASIGNVRDAMGAAEATLKRVPDSPMFYRNFVDQVIREKNREQEGGKRASYGRGGARGRTLSAAERAAEQDRRFNERNVDAAEG